jgi:phage terminase large subunit-like protein
MVASPYGSWSSPITSDLVAAAAIRLDQIALDADAIYWTESQPQKQEHDFMGLVPVKPDRDKIARMAVASAKFEAGNVHFPEEALWLADLEAELFAFPGARYDDQCDWHWSCLDGAR